jgi:cytochrome c1
MIRRACSLSLSWLLLAAFLGACSGESSPRARAFGDAEAGKTLMGRQACGSCHLIPGLQQSNGLAGPPLDHFGRRTVIAGVLPNTPGNLARWLKSPQAAVPGNAMPDMHLSEQQARDIAAFLETLK